MPIDMEDEDTPLFEAFEAHPAFERRDGSFRLTSSSLESEVAIVDDTLRVRVHLPTLSEVVLDEQIASIVEDAWYDTLERRLREGFDVTRSQGAAEAAVDRHDAEVVVSYTFDPDAPQTAANDAKALIEFVIGTYVQGAIPGYAYDAPLGELLDRALDSGEADVRDGVPPG